MAETPGAKVRIAVLREALPGEGRVALVPESVKKLSASAEVMVESGAGVVAGASDADYTAAGAGISKDRNGLLASADVWPVVNRPPAEDFAKLKRGAAIIGFLRPLDEPAALQPLYANGLTAFSMELMPRTTRAQSMDALSSMATLAGYKAVLLAAERLNRLFPLMMTAAGTAPPARVMVLGAGVAGLQAIATSRRLGAVVEAYDVRAAAGEQVRSLGAKFLEVDLGGIATEDSGGYARELTPEALDRGKVLIAEHARTNDVVIATAQVPGKRAPLLITKEAVDGMRPGSIIVDLAGASGGNCALSKPGEAYEYNGVTLMAPLNLAASVPVHASQFYSRNVTAFLGLIVQGGALKFDLGDDIVAASCVALQGANVNPRLGGTAPGK